MAISDYQVHTILDAYIKQITQQGLPDPDSRPERHLISQRRRAIIEKVAEEIVQRLINANADALKEDKEPLRISVVQTSPSDKSGAFLYHKQDLSGTRKECCTLRIKHY